MPTYYVTLTDLKVRLAIPSGDTGSDGILNSVIAGVCHQINGYCGRTFWAAAAETRYFDTEFSDVVYVDDLTSVSALKTDNSELRTYDETWSASDYELGPHNAPLVNQAYSTIQVRPRSTRAFPVGRRMVSITGTWGWPAIPPPVIEATFLQCERLYQRRNSPMGVAGPNEFGQLTALAPVDPDVKQLLAPYVRMGVIAV